MLLNSTYENTEYIISILAKFKATVEVIPHRHAEHANTWTHLLVIEKTLIFYLTTTMYNKLDRMNIFSIYDVQRVTHYWL